MCNSITWNGWNSSRSDKKKLSSTLNNSENESFADAFQKGSALIRFYLKVTSDELKNIEIDDWCDLYNQMTYAVNFDSKRLNGDAKQPAKFPL